MHPVHRCTDSFPHQQTQMPYAQHYYHPSLEAIPPMMKVDTTSRSPLPNETWPYGGNYAPSVPVGCEGCCNHSNFPGYSCFRPPYPYYPWPQQFHYHGGYPSFPEPFPVHYVSPPNYSMGEPRYEYDKNVAGEHHCCRCPNNLCNRKEDRPVRIEEQEPELERGAGGEKKSSNALVPVDFKKQVYPVAWIPPGYMNKEQSYLAEPEFKGRGKEYPRDRKADENFKPSEKEPSVWNGWFPFDVSKELKGRDEYPRDRKADENWKPSEKELSARNGWFPFDVNSVGSVNHGVDRKRTQNQPNDDRNQFSFPIFWMPKPQEEGENDSKEANTGLVSNEKSSPNLRTTSAPFSGSDDSASQPSASADNFGGEGGSKSMEKKHATKKIIPVKQLEEIVEKMKTEGDEANAKGVTSKEKEDKKEKPSSENGIGRQSSSPSKASKLEGGPKLMEKKPANQKIIPVKQLEEHGEKMKTEGDEVNAKGFTVKEKEDKKEKPSSENGIKRHSSSPSKVSKLPPVCLRVDPLPRRKNGKNGSSRSRSPPCHEEKLQEVGESSKSTSPQGKEKAQLYLQSSSCTFNKTKEEELNNKEKDGGEEVSSERKEEKKSRGETESSHEIMKGQSGESQLLTQEDKGETTPTVENLEEAKKAKRNKLSDNEAAVLIQSAYRGFEVRRWEPLKKMKQIAEVREQAAEIRSHVEALELSPDIISDNKQRLVIGETIMSLLLKLDTIQGLHPTVRDFRKSVAKELVSLQEKLDSLTTKSVSTAKLVEDRLLRTQENAPVRGEKNEAEVGHRNGTGERDHDSNFSPLEPCQDQDSPLKESTPDSLSGETSELKSGEEEGCDCDESRDKNKASPFGSSVAADKAGAGAVDKLEDGLTREVIDDGQLEILKAQAEDLELNPTAEPLPIVAEPNSADEVKLYSAGSQLLELPRVSSDEALPIGENEQNETGKCEVIQGGEVDSLLATDGTTKDGKIVDENQVHQPLVALKEEKVIADTEDGEREEVSNLHEDLPVKQGEEVSRYVDQEQTPNAEDELRRKGSETLEDVGMEIEELNMQTQEGNKENDMLCTSEQHEPEPAVSPAQKEVKEVGASSPEEPHSELLPSQNEIQGGEHKEDIRKEVPSGVEVTEECETESLEITGEENIELVDHGHETGGLVAPASAAGHEAEGGECFPISPTVTTEMGSESDRKLVGENEKLREMIEKLVEAGKEQITAISNLSGRVKDLEKKLGKKKKLRTRRIRAGSSYGKLSNDELKGEAHGVAV